VMRRALVEMERRIADGERESTSLIEVGMGVLRGESGVKVDYLAVVDAGTLLPVETVTEGTLVAVAGYVGKTRLIDNFFVG
jgi:pantoate--beta-alanine ligase